MTARNPPRVALLHSNDEFSETLARLAQARSDYRVDNYSTVRPPRRRLPRFVSSHLGRSGRYDLVQVDELLVNGPMGVALATGFRLPVVAYFRGWADHTNDHGRHGRLAASRRRLQTALLLRAVDRTLFISDRTREAFDRHFALPDPAVVPRPIDAEYYAGGTDPFDREADDRGGAGPTRLLTTTNLAYEEKYRGVTTILDGLRDVFPGHPDLEYLVAGGGEYEDALREHVASYEFADRVRVLGFRTDVSDLLAGADAFVYASFLDSFATTIPEAQAAGLPVVAGAQGGVPEAVGDAGLVVPPTAEAIGDAVASLLADDSLREELSAASRERMARFNEESVDRFVAAWDSVLGR